MRKNYEQILIKEIAEVTSFLYHYKNFKKETRDKFCESYLLSSAKSSKRLRRIVVRIDNFLQKKVGMLNG